MRDDVADEADAPEAADDEGGWVVEHHFTCSPCPGCGDPHYIDGCPTCGYGIDGYFPRTRGGDA